MKLKIPPVVVVFIVGISMWLVNYFTGISFSFPFQHWIVKLLMGLCVLVVITALFAFHKMKTTVDPMKPDKASKLVTIGIYHFTRNPMYLSMFIALLGGFVKLGNPLNLVMLLFFIWYMTKFQIKPEEEALAKIFGKDYLQYCKKVRRWI